MDRQQLIEIYQDTKSLCAEIGTPVSEKIIGILPVPEVTKKGIITVESLDTVSALIKYANFGKTAILNMANAKHKGGGVERGAMAQEECLFRCSNLFTIPDHLYPLEINELIYTHKALFVKGANYNTIWPIQADVITIAAPNLNKNHEGNVIDAHLIENYEKIMLDKMVALLSVAAINNCDNIILGAWGCGAFKNDPNVVVKLFNTALETYRYKFENIVFAVINDRNSVGNNYQIFLDNIKS